MKESQEKKIVVIGAGNVGEAIAYTLMVREQAEEIVLVDVNEERARGAAMDIFHGTGFHRQAEVRQGGYEECADAVLIIITAGVARRPWQTRLDLARTNVAIIHSITEQIMRYAKDPLLLVVSNPVDILTKEVQEVSGLRPERVIGSGTALDTARFRTLIGEQLGTGAEEVQAFVLGEHGDSQVAVWSSAAIKGQPLAEYEKEHHKELNLEEIARQVRNGGAQIIEKKGATFYGVAMAVSRIVEAICKDEHEVLPVAHVLGEAYGPWSGIAFSLLCEIGREGICQVQEMPLSEEEQKAMDQSARILKELQAAVHSECRNTD